MPFQKRPVISFQRLLRQAMVSRIDEVLPSMSRPCIAIVSSCLWIILEERNWAHLS